MSKSKLDSFVRELRPIEIEFRDKPQMVQHPPDDFELLKENYITSDKKFDIYLHDRYGLNYEHQHNFIEIQYVYAGECLQSIEGQDYVLKSGDLCILNTVTRHYIKEAKEKDVIVNFLFAPDFFDYRFFGNLGSNELFSDFFMRSVYERDNIKRHILFNLDENKRIRQIVTDIMSENFFPNLGSNEIIESSLIILFAELQRIAHSNQNSVTYTKSGKAKLADVISYIETYYQTASLKAVATNFGYSPGYLGTMLKETFGKSFTEIHREIRMMNSAKMLLSTAMPVSEIALTVGFSNLTHFYQLFRRMFGVTPQEYRLKM